MSNRLTCFPIAILICLAGGNGLLAQSSSYFVNENQTGNTDSINGSSSVASIQNELNELKSVVNNLTSIRDENEALKQTVAKQNETINSLKSDINSKVAPGHSSASMKIVGRVHADYWGFPERDAGIDAMEGGPDGPQDRFGFRRLRFGVRGDLPANMEYRIEGEFAGGNSSEFRDAWLGFNDLPFFQTVLIGNQKRPYGLDHMNSSRFNVFMERPFVIEAFNQDARRLGIASYGSSENQCWNWRFGVYNLRNVQDEGSYTNRHMQPEFASRIAKTYWYDESSGGRGYGHWGVSSTFAFPDGSTPMGNGSPGPDVNEARFQTRPEARSASRWIDTGVIDGADDYFLLGLEKVFNVGALQTVGEYQVSVMDRDPGFGSNLTFHGGYVFVSYFLTGEHIPWSRKSGTIGRIVPHENFFCIRDCDGCKQRGIGAWQVALRASYADFNDDNIFGGIGRSLTLGVNWYWSPYARMQFNWVHGTIVDTNTSALGPALVSGDYDIIGVRFMVDF